jgi:uncharacterized membrane protein HdeD (DUF308 family)
METHAHGQVHWQARQASVATTEVLQAGALAAIAAGFVMAAWPMVVAAIAQEPTAVPGIHQTLWTPPEGIWSVVFGVHHSSTPHWSWWVGHGIFGATLGLLSGVLLEKQGAPSTMRRHLL